jgi:hypothetical protein
MVCDVGRFLVHFGRQIVYGEVMIKDEKLVMVVTGTDVCTNGVPKLGTALRLMLVDPGASSTSPTNTLDPYYYG